MLIYINKCCYTGRTTICSLLPLSKSFFPYLRDDEEQQGRKWVRLVLEEESESSSSPFSILVFVSLRRFDVVVWNEQSMRKTHTTLHSLCEQVKICKVVRKKAEWKSFELCYGCTHMNIHRVCNMYIRLTRCNAELLLVSIYTVISVMFTEQKINDNSFSI